MAQSAHRANLIIKVPSTTAHYRIRVQREYKGLLGSWKIMISSKSRRIVFYFMNDRSESITQDSKILQVPSAK